MMGMISATMVVTSSDRHGKPTLAQPGNREWVSVIQSINSRGQAIPPFIIVAGVHHLANWYEDSALPKDWVISTTPNGWTTNEKGVEWIQHFGKHTKPRTQGAYWMGTKATIQRNLNYSARTIRLSRSACRRIHHIFFSH